MYIAAYEGGTFIGYAFVIFFIIVVGTECITEYRKARYPEKSNSEEDCEVENEQVNKNVEVDEIDL